MIYVTINIIEEDEILRAEQMIGSTDESSVTQNEIGMGLKVMAIHDALTYDHNFFTKEQLDVISEHMEKLQLQWATEENGKVL